MTPDAAPGPSPAQLSFVHRFVPGTSLATLLVLHGTGGDENDLLPLARELAPDAALLSPRGPVLEHGMPRFFRRIAVGVFDEADLTRRAADLAGFVAAAARAYGRDPARVYALGYSNGANMAAALLLLHPDALAGGALLRAMLPLEPPTPPDLAGKPVRIAAGLEDPYAPRERVDALADRLKQAGAAVEVGWQAAGHALDEGEMDAVRAWISRHVR
jgi:phospholipase/carboxylesterase